MLAISNLEKSTAKKMLMTNVNINLHAGEILALVGEHQSGKSLLSKLILNLCHKTKGSIKIKANKCLGAFIPKECFLGNDTVVTIIKDYCKINNHFYHAHRVKNILAIFDMRKLLHTKVKNLTPSQLDRLKIALPLIVRSDILILDAPFTNLAVNEAKDLRVLLRTISVKLKTAIIITALKMSEVEEFCDTIAIIDDGMIVAMKTYNEMIAKEFTHARLAVTVAQPNYAAQVVTEELNLPTKVCGDQILVETKPENVQRVVDKLLEKKITVFGAHRAFRSLDLQYLEIINQRKNYY